MHLLSKTAIIAGVIIIILVAVKLAVQNTPQTISESQAVANVTHFLEQSTPPFTVINITSVTPSQYAGSWHIVTAITINGTSPCPSYYVDSFDYPQYGFVTRLENNYTANCIVNGINNNYVIGAAPVAIAQSYALNISQVRTFVNRYGYSSVHVTASPVSNQEINGISYTNAWAVYYTDTYANYSVQVYLQPNGTLITAT